MSDDFAYIFGDPRVNPDKPDAHAFDPDSPEYQAFVESMVPHCRCANNRPCDGVLAGGLCDDIQDDPLDEEEDCGDE